MLFCFIVIRIYVAMCGARAPKITYVTQAWRNVGLPTFLFLSSRLAVAA